MADAEVETALRHWGPRLIQNGVDYNDMLATIARIDTWDQWLPEWARTADEQAGYAREAEAAGHRVSAGHAWRRAATDRHFGKFVWMVDLELAAAALAVSRVRYRRAWDRPKRRRVETDKRRISVAS